MSKYEVSRKIIGILVFHFIFSFIITPYSASAQDGLPNPSGATTPVNICYSSGNQLVTEVFNAPNILDDFGVVEALNASPIDPNRQLENIPSFGLAKFHWWLLGGIILPRAQRQYADCVGQAKAFQKLLNELPYDSPASPYYLEVLAVREYHVPFEAVQRLNGDFTLPPSREDAIQHAIAAISTVNLTVFHRYLCESRRDALERRVRRLLPRPRRR